MSDEEIVKEFLVESYENLDRLDQDLIALEKDPADRERLASIFRTVHTIKGTSGFLAFNQLEAVTHVGESLLARLRDGQLVLTPEITTALLSTVDAVRQMLASIEAEGSEGERNDQELIATLSGLLEDEAKAKPAAATAKAEAEQEDLSVPADNIGDILIKRGAAKVSEVYKALEQQQSGDPRHVGEILVEQGAVKSQDVLEALTTQQQSHGQSASDSTIRVDVAQLDRLMNRMGELVLLRNQIVQYTNSSEDSELLGTSQRLNLLTTELQEGVMKTRMQPIGNIWSKFPRTVRDVALGCGKQVRIEMEGKETELDKTIIEAIKDPLTHLVRNAVDHGIETPAARLAAGKEAEGLLRMRAFHEGGQVNIEITDDGAGLDFEKIRNQAIRKMLITADQAARMTEREITRLIFLPGFSTAEKVTNVSGRGVGMDVVRTNIEKIGGTVDVQSSFGKGSTVRMKIPLTLAIIPALIVTTAADRYAIPQVSLLELVRLEAGQARKGIERVNGAPVYRLRGRLLPLVYLQQELYSETRGRNGDGEREPAAGQLLDFAQARHKHLQWVGQLREALDLKTKVSAEQAGAFRDCALGKWLYGAAPKEFGAMEEMQLLEAKHRQFHALAREIVVLVAERDRERAELQFQQVEPLTAAISALLTAAEKKIAETQNVNIVVLRADDRQFGLVVDEINDTEEIVVKPLSKQLKIINTYAGATIMGDGKVALILDVMGLAQRANVIAEVRDRALVDKEGQGGGAESDAARRNAVLLFENGKNGKMAVDLSLVARLEEFPASMVEEAAGQEVVQYRGQIMPLVRVSEVLAGGSGNRGSEQRGTESLHVVVYSDQGRSVGLVVDRILDIVEESFVIEKQTARNGVLGSAVIQKRVTDILDVPGLIASASGKQALAAFA